MFCVGVVSCYSCEENLVVGLVMSKRKGVWPILKCGCCVEISLGTLTSDYEPAPRTFGCVQDVRVRAKKGTWLRTKYWTIFGAQIPFVVHAWNVPFLDPGRP